MQKKEPTNTMGRLFVYGTLAPGQPNAHLLEKLGGIWARGYVWGKLYQEGWGAGMGCPGIRLEGELDRVPGYVFSSDQLGKYWDTLDGFEGDQYAREKTTVTLADGNGELTAYIYALK